MIDINGIFDKEYYTQSAIIIFRSNDNNILLDIPYIVYNSINWYDVSYLEYKALKFYNEFFKGDNLKKFYSPIITRCCVVNQLMKNDTVYTTAINKDNLSNLWIACSKNVINNDKYKKYYDFMYNISHTRGNKIHEIPVVL